MTVQNINTYTKKADRGYGRLSIRKPKAELFCVRFFKGSDASCANVAVHFFAIFDVRNFLHVYFESSSRFTVGVAYVVARSLTFTANVAYSRHIKHLRFGLIFSS